MKIQLRIHFVLLTLVVLQGFNTHSIIHTNPSSPHQMESVRSLKTLKTDIPLNIVSEGKTKISEVQYYPHLPIIINGNFSEVAIENGWNGNGTSRFPYIIENISITSTGTLIFIKNSEANFIVQNCILTSGETGIVLENVTNGFIFDNKISNNNVGIFITQSKNLTISTNTVQSSGSSGINIVETENILIIDNHLEQNGFNGISSQTSMNLTVTRNNFKNNGNDALTLKNTINSSVNTNFIIGNSNYGIELTGSHNSSVLNNTIVESGSYGVFLNSSNCLVMFNRFVYNNQGSSQAYDAGTGNSFIYNHWANWTWPDENSDGTVDDPFPISGPANNYDYFPEVSPTETHILLKPSIIYPRGGETLVGVTTIQWGNAEDLLWWHNIVYSFYCSSDEGATWHLIADGITDSTGFRYNWDTGNLPDGEYLLKVVAICTEGTEPLQAKVISDTPFHIFNVAHTISTSDFYNPRGGDYSYFGEGGGSVPVSWTEAVDSHGHQITYTLSYSPNAGDNWYEIASDLPWFHPSVAYHWDVFNLHTSPLYLVKINATCSEGVWIESVLPQTFTIEVADHMLSTPVVIYPNGNEILSKDITIRWSPSVDKLDHTVLYTLYYSSNSGTTWNLIDSDLVTNHYEWDTTGLTGGSGYLIKVRGTCSEGTYLYDESNHKFSLDKISPTIDKGIFIGDSISETSISWNAFDLNPSWFEVKRDGEVISNGSWAGGSITFPLNETKKGNYTYICTVYDKGGNSASDMLIVMVGLLLFIDQPADIVYEEGTLGHTITWHPTADNPATYDVTRDGESIENGIWEGQVINITVDGLDAGNYTFICTVWNNDSISTSDTVLVQVSMPPIPIITPAWTFSILIFFCIFVTKRKRKENFRK